MRPRKRPRSMKDLLHSGMALAERWRIDAAHTGVSFAIRRVRPPVPDGSSTRSCLRTPMGH